MLSSAVLRQSAWWVLGRNLVFGLAVIAGLWLTVPPHDGDARWVQLVLATAAVGGVLLSRSWPVLALLVTAVATGVAWVFGVTADPFVLTGFTVFVLAERRGSRRFPWWMLIAALLVLFLSMGLGAEGVEDRFRGMLLSTVVLAASWVLGVRTRQARRESAARSRAEERLRMSRDVHDVLSHSLGTIGVRAGIAAHVSTLDNAQLRAVLHEIADDARTSLAELKDLLQQERSNDEGVSATPSSLPLVGALADLAQAAERTGIRAIVEVDGDLDRLPAALRTTVHRIAQEAVTNVIRHAAASSVSIGVRISDESVKVEVRDDGQGAPQGFREGHGLTGMRERVGLRGGTFRATTSTPGFIVTATMPCRVAAESGGVS
ncbi:sensor histidine kinase [Leucobacter exalbidus]|uniref:sensor histidine kinase n=1 Tax=Leucobacter exalbidus TaxID=662960 RepID=UPI001AE3C4D4